MNWIERLLRRVVSFRAKQRLLIMTACSIVLVTFLCCALSYGYLFLNRESRDRLGALADIIASDVGAALVFSDQRAISRSLESLRADSSVKQLFVLDARGGVCAHYSHRGENLAAADLQRRLDGVRAELRRQLFELSPEVERPITRDGVTLGSVIVEQDERVIVQRGLAVMGTGLAILLLSLGISYLLAARFSRIITEPVSAMARIMRQISLTKNFSVRVPDSDTEEIHQLSDSFNHMLEEISHRDSALLERQERLNQQANFDVLTGLPNRSLFNDRLEQALRRAVRTGEKLALLFIDLDDFKLINDTHGHRTGDLLLQETASRLMEGTRGEDTVARLGGDEFIIFLQDVKLTDNALMVARKHRERLLAPYLIEGRRLFVSASIGVALFPEHGVTAETLVKGADTAMYLAKERGKNNIELFSNSLHQKVSERLGLSNDLHRALEQGEFELYYQPRINLRRRSWAGVEALLRWRHPELGMIPPDKFISLAEKSGLILPIGEWVICEACRQLRQWHAAGAPIPRVSVNVSPLQLHRQNLVGLVREAIASHRLCSRSLEVEITESALMENLDQSVAALQELQRIGVVVSIDDFGTGYSSLSHLRSLPIDILKIDRSFMLRVHESEEDRQILAAIIAMAHSLHLEVVAEGVEHAEQERILAALGCPEVQGYYYSPPLPADELLERYRAATPPIGAEAGRTAIPAGGRHPPPSQVRPSLENDPAFLASKYPAVRRFGVGRYSARRALPDCRPEAPVVVGRDKGDGGDICRRIPVRPALCNGEAFCRKNDGRVTMPEEE